MAIDSPHFIFPAKEAMAESMGLEQDDIDPLQLKLFLKETARQKVGEEVRC